MRASFALILLCAIATADITELTSNTQENLRGISVVTSSVFWASGTHGTFIRMTDCCVNLEVGQVPGAEKLDFRDVEGFSADLAYLLAAGPGDHSRIYKTTDGGKKWILQFTNQDPKGFFDCMAFWDPDHGIAVGDPVDGKFQLIKTEDSGKNWTPVPAANLPPAIEGEGAFAASGTCIATQGKKNVWFVTGGSAARVFRSRDAGETWSVAETPIVHGPASAGIFSVAFRDARHGVIAGGDYKQPGEDAPSLALTEDGGKTWTLANMSPQHYFSAVTFVPGRNVSLVAVGTGQYAAAKNLRSKKWDLFEPLIRAARTEQQPAELNAVAAARHDFRIITVGMKGAIFLIDDICRVCSKK